jgi:hypothetical protein
MNSLNDKYSLLIEKFKDFINNLDNEFSNLKEKIEDDLGNISEISKLAELSENVMSKIKSNQSDTAIEKSNVIEELKAHAGNNPMSMSIEISNIIRNLIQKNISNIDQEYNEIINKFSKPVIGSFWKETNEWIGNFGEDNFKKTSKSGEVQLTISDDSIENLFSFMEKNFCQFADQNIAFFNEKINNIQTEIDHLLVSKKINYTISNLTAGLSIQYGDLIKSVLRFDSPYQGRYPKSNFKKMIMEVRSYSVMFILLLSTLGINREAFKDNPIMLNIIYVTSFTLIGIGVLFTYIKIQDTKVDKIEEELRKAKEKINMEIKRALNEFINEWKNTVVSKSKMILFDLSFEIENIVKEDSRNKDLEKQKLNQLLQELDKKERRLTENYKTGENLKTQITQLKT